MLHHQTYTTSGPILGHHHGLSSPKTVVPTSSGLRTGPAIYRPTIQNTPHVVTGIQQTSFTPQRVSVDRNTVGARISSQITTIIPGFLVSAQGERQVDFKTVGEQFMRIKDISSEYCYKFRVSNQVPSIQLHPTDNLRVLLTFSGDYVDDLFKFLSALEDNRFAFRQGERIAVLQFRFISVQFKNQIIEIIQTLSRRASFSTVQTVPTLGNYRSMSSILNRQTLEQNQPITIQTINQGHRSERSNVERVQHVNVNQIPQNGINAFKRTDITPPVALAPFPAPQITQINPTVHHITAQQTIVTQRVSQQQPASIIQQIGATNINQSVQITRLAQQNRNLNATIRSLQHQSQIIIQENSSLQVQIATLRQQVEHFRIDASTKTQFSDGQSLRLKTQLLQITQNLHVAERRLRQVQLQLSQSKTAEMQAKNQRETIRINFTKQITELQSKINIITSSTSSSNSAQFNNLRIQFDQQRNIIIDLENELNRLRQLLAEAQRNLFEYGEREKTIVDELNFQFEQERQNMNVAIQERNQHIQLLEQELFKARQNIGASAHTAHVEANIQFNNELQVERQKFIQQYELLRLQKSKQIDLLTVRLEQVIAEDARKFEAIQQLQDQLNNTIHSQDLSRSNANFEAVDKMRTHYEQQLTTTKSIYENELFQLNEQITYYQNLAEQYQTKYGGLLDEYRVLSNNQRTDGYQSVTTSQNSQQILLRNQIAALEQQRNQLIAIVERYQGDIVLHQQVPQEYVQQEITYITYQQDGNVQEDRQVVQRVVYQSDINHQVVRTTVYKTQTQDEGLVETESIQRITTQINTGEEQVETIERVTYQQNDGQEQRITTYEVNDGEQRYIHKVTTDSIQGRPIHQVDTNIVVHQEGGQIVYDIQTEQTDYVNRQALEGYSLNESGLRNRLIQQQNQGALHGYVQNSYNGEGQVIYQGQTVEVVNQGGNIVIEGADYQINVPQGSRNIQITQQSYQQINNF